MCQHCQCCIFAKNSTTQLPLCGKKTYYLKSVAEFVTRRGSRKGAPVARAPPPLTLGFETPNLSIFGPYLIFPKIFFASLCSTYYFFNMLLFQRSNTKMFQPRFIWHMMSHLEVFVFSLSFTHFRLLGVHLSLSCF